MLAATAAAAMTLAAPASALADEDVLDGADDVAESDESDTTEMDTSPVYFRMKKNAAVRMNRDSDKCWPQCVAVDKLEDPSLTFQITNNSKYTCQFHAYVGYVLYSYDSYTTGGELKQRYDYYYSDGDVAFGLADGTNGGFTPWWGKESERAEIATLSIEAGGTKAFSFKDLPNDIGKIKTVTGDEWSRNQKYMKALVVQPWGTNANARDWYFACKDFTYTATWGVTMYRLYNPYSGEHHYTASATERDALVKAGWRNEGVAWNAPTKTGAPVYRLYNPYSGDHHYTTNKDEYEACKKAGWNDEGVGWYSADAKSGAPLYRGFNRFVTIGTHHYTIASSEMKNMVAHGWRDEGVGWYGLK